MYIIGRFINGITINPMEYVVDGEGNEMVFTSKKNALAHIKYESEEEAERDGMHLRRYEPCCKCKHPLSEPFPQEDETGIYCDECKPEETIILDVPTITDSKELGHLIQERLDDYSKESYSHLFTVGNLAESIAMDIIHSFNYDNKVSQKEKMAKVNKGKDKEQMLYCEDCDKQITPTGNFEDTCPLCGSKYLQGIPEIIVQVSSGHMSIVKDSKQVGIELRDYDIETTTDEEFEAHGETVQEDENGDRYIIL